MAITTADQWFAAARQKVPYIKTASTTTVALQQYSLFALTGTPGAGTLAVGNTTSGVLFSGAAASPTAGVPGINAFGTGNTGYLAQAQFRNSVTGGAQLYDRIFGVGAVSATALATTTLTGQPSIAARVPTVNAAPVYAGLEILLEITTTFSATATTVSVGYTNQAGTTGRTTVTTTSLSGFTTPRVVAMALQAGDTGVQRIDSVTVSGTVATAGAFNVILARRVADFDVRVANAQDLQSWDALGAPVVFQDSAFWLVSMADANSSGTPSLGFTVMNG